MRLQTRLFLLIGLVMATAFAGLEILSYRRAKDTTVEDLRGVAERIRGVLMSTRRVYHHQFPDSGLPLSKKTVGFLPAHALARISEDFSNWDASGLSFNNVSDQPRNPFQSADAVEREAMAFFRADPDRDVRFQPYVNARIEPEENVQIPACRSCPAAGLPADPGGCCGTERGGA